MATRASRLADALVPQAPNLRIEEVQVTDISVTVRLTSTATTAMCPRCQHQATRIRGSYVRMLADLPWSGSSVRLHLRVRKFACDLPLCPQRIFAERLPNVTVRAAHNAADGCGARWGVGGDLLAAGKGRTRTGERA
jgi:transposase